jgi:hypothetical protein
VIGWRFLRATGSSRAVATAAMAIPCAAYVPSGAWIDLVRVDSLWLFFVAASTALAYRARHSPPGLVAAGALLVAAFFVKQTAAPFMVAVTLGLWVLDRRAALWFVAGLALFGLPALWAMQRATDGRFWFYIYAVHHSHAFELPAVLRVPGKLSLYLLPALPLVAWALVVDRTPALRWTAWLAAWGVIISALGKGTLGGYINAFIPGFYFGAIFIGVATTRLLFHADAAGNERRAALAWALVAATLLVAPGVVPRAISRVHPSSYRWPVATGYSLSMLYPSAADRARNEELLARLRAVDGEVWLPSRPWLARRAGKQPLAGEMEAVDVGSTAHPLVGLSEALRTRRFAAVVIDEPHEALLKPLFDRLRASPFEGGVDVVGVRRPTWWLEPPAAR